MSFKKHTYKGHTFYTTDRNPDPQPIIDHMDDLWPLVRHLNTRITNALMRSEMSLSDVITLADKRSAVHWGIRNIGYKSQEKIKKVVATLSYVYVKQGELECPICKKFHNHGHGGLE